MKRRTFLKQSLAGAGLTLAAVSGLVTPRVSSAAGWPRKAFGTTNQAEAIQQLFGSQQAAPSKAVKITAPIQAENGNVVPVGVKADLDQVEAIAVVVENNPRPMAASINLSGQAKGYLKTRVKMAETSNVTAYVKANGKLYTASRQVKVTIGGCGG
jgi:sulfur-oxidizing protein SoxY